MDVNGPVGIRHLGPSGSGVVGPQGPIYRQTTRSHISGDSSKKGGPIAQARIHNFINSMRRRCAFCIDAPGGHTMY